MVYSKIPEREGIVSEALEVVAGKLLAERKLTVAVAESCTGGLLGARLTDVSGSSAYMLGGVIAYADSVKRHLLGVPAEVIEQNGAVSSEVAALMARGVRKITGADIGISVTGIAGPTGGTAAKPVGTTYIGVATGRLVRVEHRVWEGDRQANREQSVEAALRLLLDQLTGRGED
jgi:nicotinamide-nucleotide amidase